MADDLHIFRIQVFIRNKSNRNTRLKSSKKTTYISRNQSQNIRIRVSSGGIQPVRTNRFLDSHTVCEPVTKILENVTLVFDFIFHSCTYI